MFQEFINYWKNIINFRGRAQRREYWVACLCNYSISLVLVWLTNICMTSCVDMVNGNINHNVKPISIALCLAFLLLLGLYSIASCIAGISLCVRRCHDVGLSGFVYLLCVIGIPFCGIGGIAWIVICCLDSKEDNKWGINRKRLGEYTSDVSIWLSVCIASVLTVLYMLFSIVTGVSTVLDMYKEKYNEPSNMYNWNFDYETSDQEEEKDELDYVIPTESAEDTKETKVDEVKEVEAEPTKQVEKAKVNTNANFTATTWVSSEVSIGGKVITLPCSYSDIESLGFTARDDEAELLNETLEDNQYTLSCLVENDLGQKFNIRFYNTSGSDCLVKDSDVYAVGFDDFYDLPEIEICGGYVLGMTVDEVKSLAGEPDYVYVNDDNTYQSIEYYYDKDKSYNGGFSLYFREGKLYSMQLENMNY